MTSSNAARFRILLVGLLSLMLCGTASAEYKVKVKFPWIRSTLAESSLRVTASEMQIEVPNQSIRSVDKSPGGLTLSFPTSKVTPTLIQAAIEGREIPEIVILVAESAGRGQPVVYLEYRLDRCTVKSWSTSGGASNSAATDFEFSYSELQRIPAHTPEWRDTQAP